MKHTRSLSSVNSANCKTHLSSPDPMQRLGGSCTDCTRWLLSNCSCGTLMAYITVTWCRHCLKIFKGTGEVKHTLWKAADRAYLFQLGTYKTLWTYWHNLGSLNDLWCFGETPFSKKYLSLIGKMALHRNVQWRSSVQVISLYNVELSDMSLKSFNRTSCLRKNLSISDTAWSQCLVPSFQGIQVMSETRDFPFQYWTLNVASSITQWGT